MARETHTPTRERFHTALAMLTVARGPKTIVGASETVMALYDAAVNERAALREALRRYEQGHAVQRKLKWLAGELKLGDGHSRCECGLCLSTRAVLALGEETKP